MASARRTRPRAWHSNFGSRPRQRTAIYSFPCHRSTSRHDDRFCRRPRPGKRLVGATVRIQATLRLNAIKYLSVLMYLSVLIPILRDKAENAWLKKAAGQRLRSSVSLASDLAGKFRCVCRHALHARQPLRKPWLPPVRANQFLNRGLMIGSSCFIAARVGIPSVLSLAGCHASRIRG